MAVKAVAQTDIVDVTDAYTLVLTNESHTYPGGTTAALAGSATTQLVAYRGSDQVPCTVDVTAVTAQGGGAIPTGVTVTKDSDATAPTLTVAVTTAVTSAFALDVPVVVNGDVTIHKVFSAAIALVGSNGKDGADGTSVTVSSTSVTYQAFTSATTAPTGTWGTSVPTVAAGSYLWTRTIVTYSDGKSTTAYSVSRSAADGTSVTVSSTAVTYQASSSGTTAPTDTWSSSVPSVTAGQYLWTRTIVTYSDGKSTTSYSVSYRAADGAAGADALSLVVTSSAGTIFKNSNSATTLTAHVFKGPLELTSSTSPTLASVGTIKWYKDGGTTAVATGQTLAISAGAVTSKATYVAQLEG